MKQVTANGEVFSCNKAIKGIDYVHLFDEDNALIASFEGISNFDGYSIDTEWDSPETTETDYILDIDYRLSVLELQGMEV